MYSIKHAFPDGKKGEISIDFEKEGNNSVLMVSDTGIGFPGDIDFRNTETLGLQSVNTLISQLHAAIEIGNGSSGTKFKITMRSESK